jgi:hypothetical protein
VQAEAARRHVSFIAVDDYGPAALLALLGPHCMVTVGLEPRWAWFDLPSASGAISGQSGLLLRSTRRREPPTVADWSSLAEIGTLARVRDGQTAETYRLYAGIARPGAEAAALLPCPPRG